MGNLVRCLLLLAVFPVSQVPDRALVTATVDDLASTTGFPLRKPVSFEILSRKQVSQFMDDRIKEAVKPDEIRAEELTLKKLGFVPTDFRLRETMLSLLAEQTAAFYDYHRKKLYLIDWTSSSLRASATVHELAHALADQSYSLEKFARRVEHDSEASAARQAVVEGQADWLMRDYIKRHPAETTSGVVSDPESTIFDKAPLYLRETLTFPYNEGETFQQAVYAKFGKAAFRKVFEEPPVSTQQILHPEKYFAGQKPVKVSLPSLRKMHRLVEGPLGELDHSILLRQYTTDADAKEVGPHLLGAHFELWESKKLERVSMVYRSVWDSEAWATRYFLLYKQVLRGKWKRVEVTEESASTFRGDSEDGAFSVDLSGSTVTSYEGLAAARNKMAQKPSSS